jgi:4'-phosphopantetheinyl transferase EntD
VAYALRTPGEVPVDRLHPLEEVHVRRAVPSRRLEMAAGRDAAREALRSLGTIAEAIPAKPDRSPQWPAGIVGSITHTKSFCMAVAAHAIDLRGIGIDAEPDEALERELWASIASPREIAEIERSEDPGRRARWIFCAKEAAYKCQYPLTGLLLEFADLEIRWSNEKETAHGDSALVRFSAQYTRDAGPFRSGDEIPGLLVPKTERHVVAVCTLSQG